MNDLLPNIQSKVVEILFSEPQLDIVESTAQLNLMHCGVGSGKTFVIGARSIMHAALYPNIRGFIGANTIEQLTKSTLVGVFKFWALIGLKRDVHYVVDRKPPKHFKTFGEPLKKYGNTISMKNGCLIFLSSLENYQAIDGTEFGWGELDETKDSKEQAVREVILARLRQVGLWLNKLGNITTIKEDGIVGYNPLSIYTSPAKVDWLIKWFKIDSYASEISARIFSKVDYFRKRTGDMLIVIASTFHNADNLPPGYIEKKLIQPNEHNPQRVKMLVYGSPFGKSGNEYYTRWDREVHVDDSIVWPEGLPVTMGFDFNRRPYVTMGLYKVWFKEDVQRWHIHKFDEICSPPPNNVTELMCEEAIELYGYEFENGIIYYGDYSGGNDRTNSLEDDYDVVDRVFINYMLNNRVTPNKIVVKRKEFMNKIMFGTKKLQTAVPIDFTCSSRCENFIMDCDFLKEGPDGGKLKEEVTGEDGKRYQKFGHTSDETEYVVCGVFEDYFKQ